MACTWYDMIRFYMVRYTVLGVRERHSTPTGLVSGFGLAGDLGSAGALAKRGRTGQDRID